MIFSVKILVKQFVAKFKQIVYIFTIDVFLKKIQTD